MSDNIYVHPSALNESIHVGERTRIWAFAHVMDGAVIGADANIGDHAFVEGGAVLGNGVTVKNGVSVWEGVTLADHVFVGPNAVFANDRYPRSARNAVVKDRYASREWLAGIHVKEGASIGANATVVGPVMIGAYSMVAAGAVVAKDVVPFALVAGTPARVIGFVCMCGQRLPDAGPLVCRACGRRYGKTGDSIALLD